MAEKATEDQKGRKFILRGGKRSGMEVRLYPNNGREVRQGKPALYDEWLTFGDDMYRMPLPADQDPDKPFMVVNS